MSTATLKDLELKVLAPSGFMDDDATTGDDDMAEPTDLDLDEDEDEDEEDKEEEAE